MSVPAGHGGGSSSPVALVAARVFGVVAAVIGVVLIVFAATK